MAGGLMSEFKKFIMRGNAMDMAVGIVIGAAFTSVVNSLVSDVIMPPLGLLLGDVDFTSWYIILKQPAGVADGVHYASLEAAKAAGATTLNIGLFINSIISFIIVAFAIFMIIRFMNKMHAEANMLEGKTQAEEAPTTKECPYCFTSISIKATRCPDCTSYLDGPEP